MFILISVICGLVAVDRVSDYIKNQTAKAVNINNSTSDLHENDPAPTRLADKIPEGMRAVTIEIENNALDSESIRPGDIIDVIAVTSIVGKETGTVSRVVVESVCISDVSVLSKNSRVNSGNKISVTLIVTPSQAGALIAAKQTGLLDCILRNPDDKQQGTYTDIAYTKENGVTIYQSTKPSQTKTAENIDPGLRIITLPVDATDGISGNIEPGDRVDVLFTCPFDYFSTKGAAQNVGSAGMVTGTHMASKIIMQDIEVFEVAKGADNTAQTASVLVTPDQSEILTVLLDATNKCKIRLIARNPYDSETVVTSGQLLIELLTQKQESSRVDVIRGNKVFERKFFKTKPDETAETNFFVEK